MKILIIDGQGGKLGKLIIEKLKERLPHQVIHAVGTNSIATATMLKAGADFGATGENPVVWNAADSDIIVGPLGIVVANALMGEVTPPMAAAVGSCRGEKLLIPLTRCNNHVVGAGLLSIPEYVSLTVDQVIGYLAV